MDTKPSSAARPSDDRPELLGALARGDEGVGAVSHAVDEREHLGGEGGQAEQQRDDALCGEQSVEHEDSLRVRKHRRRQTSMTSVTGPSLTSETSIIAPNRPVATSIPRPRSAATTASTNGSATGPGAAAPHDGRRPLRVSA